MRDKRRESAPIQRFRELTAPRTQRELLQIMRRWRAENNHPLNVGRNLSRIISGDAREVSDTLRPLLLAFCRDALKLEVDDDEFDVKDRRPDHGAAFAQANASSRSFLEDACGAYALFRPRMSKGKIQPRNPSERYHPWDAEIEFGPAGSFKFEVWLEEQTWNGTAYCSGGIFYFFAAEREKQSIVSAILAPLGPLKDGVLVGTIMMGVRFDEQDLHVTHLAAAARPVAMARKGRGAKAREEHASDWLDRQVASGAGFCIPLLETRHIPTDESR